MPFGWFCLATYPSDDFALGLLPRRPNALMHVHFVGFLLDRLRISDPPLPENLWRDFPLNFLLKFFFENIHFRSISRTAGFGDLIALPFRSRGKPRGRFLSDVPFGWFSLPTYPVVGFAKLRTLPSRSRLFQAALRCGRYCRSTLSGLRKG